MVLQVRILGLLLYIVANIVSAAVIPQDGDKQAVFSIAKALGSQADQYQVIVEQGQHLTIAIKEARSFEPTGRDKVLTELAKKVLPVIVYIKDGEQDKGDEVYNTASLLSDNKAKYEIIQMSTVLEQWGANGYTDLGKVNEIEEPDLQNKRLAPRRYFEPLPLPHLPLATQIKFHEFETEHCRGNEIYVQSVAYTNMCVNPRLEPLGSIRVENWDQKDAHMICVASILHCGDTGGVGTSTHRKCFWLGALQQDCYNGSILSYNVF